MACNIALAGRFGLDATDVMLVCSPLGHMTGYAAGMLLGPKVSSVLFASYGGGVMLAHLASLWTAFVIFTVVFASDDPAATGARASVVAEDRVRVSG